MNNILKSSVMNGEYFRSILVLKSEKIRMSFELRHVTSYSDSPKMPYREKMHDNGVVPLRLWWVLVLWNFMSLMESLSHLTVLRLICETERRTWSFWDSKACRKIPLFDAFPNVHWRPLLAYQRLVVDFLTVSIIFVVVSIVVAVWAAITNESKADCHVFWSLESLLFPLFPSSPSINHSFWNFGLELSSTS